MAETTTPAPSDDTPKFAPAGLLDGLDMSALDEPASVPAEKPAEKAAEAAPVVPAEVAPAENEPIETPAEAVAETTETAEEVAEPVAEVPAEPVTEPETAPIAAPAAPNAALDDKETDWRRRFDAFRDKVTALKPGEYDPFVHGEERDRLQIERMGLDEDRRVEDRRQAAAAAQAHAETARYEAHWAADFSKKEPTIEPAKARAAWEEELTKARAHTAKQSPNDPQRAETAAIARAEALYENRLNLLRGQAAARKTPVVPTKPATPPGKGVPAGSTIVPAQRQPARAVAAPQDPEDAFAAATGGQIRSFLRG